MSEDLGDSWVYVTSWPPPFRTVTDLIFRDGLFVAAVDPLTSMGDARVTVSVDAKTWNDVVLREEIAASYALVHDGRQFYAAGSHSTVFTSIDGYYWNELATPVGEVDYLSAAWNGSKLVVAGGITWWYWWGGTTPPFERPVGLSSIDGGETWEIFNIDGFYESRGMAWGNGRFVSVGQSTPISSSGAIYTSE